MKIDEKKERKQTKKIAYKKASKRKSDLKKENTEN
jgi:hypothetical protein